MFENHFGFIRRPFAATPDVELFVDCDTMSQALDAVEYTVRSGQGVAVLTAPPGTGKTMLCQKLIRSVGDEFVVSLLASPGTTTRLGLLQAIYYGLGRRAKKKHAGIAVSEMRRELIDAVQSLRVKASGIALIVDEAHLLQPDQLEEIRVLSNLADNGRPLVRPVLSGNLTLEEHLTDPALKAFSQRIRCHVYLDALRREESANFVRRQLSAGGCRDREIFDSAAVARIAEVSDGIPRCLNQLCDQSLFIAAKQGAAMVTVDIVNDALRDLIQLPLSWNCVDLGDSTTHSSAGSLTEQPVMEQNTSVSHETAPTSEVSELVGDCAVFEVGAATVEQQSSHDDSVAQPVPVREASSASVIEVGSSAPVESEPESEVVEPEVVESAAVEVAEPRVIETADECPETEEDLLGLVEDDVPLKDQLSETFRHGVLSTPEPLLVSDITEQPKAYDVNRDDPAAPDADSELKEIAAVRPRFDEAVAPDQLTGRDHFAANSGHGPVPVRPLDRATAEIGDKWTRAGRPKVEEEYIAPGRDLVYPPSSDPVDGSPEEELLASCLDTRREIAGMLDTLESYVSDALVDSYDVVIPETDADVVNAAGGPALRVTEVAAPAEDLVAERLQRAIDQERN